MASNLYLALKIQFWQFTMSETEEVQRERERQRQREGERLPVRLAIEYQLSNCTMAPALEVDIGP